MKTYNVLIEFKSGPAFGRILVQAENKDKAEQVALRVAKECGFDDKPRKFVTEEIL